MIHELLMQINWNKTNKMNKPVSKFGENYGGSERGRGGKNKKGGLFGGGLELNISDTVNTRSMESYWAQTPKFCNTVYQR